MSGYCRIAIAGVDPGNAVDRPDRREIQYSHLLQKVARRPSADPG